MAAMSASLALLSVSGGDGHPDSVLTGHGGNMDGVEVCSVVGAGAESVGRATDAMVKAGFVFSFLLVFLALLLRNLCAPTGCGRRRFGPWCRGR
jgi:hypothetical protein